MALQSTALRARDGRLLHSNIRAYDFWRLMGRKPAHTWKLTRVGRLVLWATLRDRGSGGVNCRPRRCLRHRRFIVSLDCLYQYNVKVNENNRAPVALWPGNTSLSAVGP